MAYEVSVCLACSSYTGESYGRSQNAGSSFPSGHVELFIHGSSLQHPQKFGFISQVQFSVSPPQDPPGDRSASAVERPAGRRISPKQPFTHGSTMQHPRNLVPVSHEYLMMVRHALVTKDHLRSGAASSTYQVPPRGQKNSPGLAAT
jgi:hypothetical protein